MSLIMKICGVANEESLFTAVEAGADLVGFVLAESPRRVSLERARRLVAATPSNIGSVVVLHHPSVGEVADAVEVGSSLIQTEVTREILNIVDGSKLLPVIHDGERSFDELPELSREFPEAFDTILFEAGGRGGRGVEADRKNARHLAVNRRMILAGGLRTDNVAEAIEEVNPAGVDVSSGVESYPGTKDPVLVTDFVAAVRAAASTPGAGHQQ